MIRPRPVRVLSSGTALFAAIGRIDALRDHTDMRLDRLHDEVHEVGAAVASLDRRLTVAGG